MLTWTPSPHALQQRRDSLLDHHGHEAGVGLWQLPAGVDQGVDTVVQAEADGADRLGVDVEPVTHEHAPSRSTRR